MTAVNNSFGSTNIYVDMNIEINLTYSTLILYVKSFLLKIK